MSHTPPGAGHGRLPIIELVVDAWRLAFERLADFAFLGAAPALALCGLAALRTIAAGDEPSGLWLVTEQLMWTFIWASLGVSWHRLVLLERVEKTAWAQMPFGHREARFFLYAVVTRAPGVMVVLLMSRSDPNEVAGLIFLFGIAQVVLAVMFPLVFPGAAIDRDRGFGGAWRLLRSSALPLFIASVLAALPVLVLMIPLSPIAAIGSGTPMGVLFTPFEVLPALLAEGIVAIVVALAYRRLTDHGGVALAPTGRED